MNAGDMFGMNITVSSLSQVEGAFFDIYEYSECTTKFSTSTADANILESTERQDSHNVASTSATGTSGARWKNMILLPDIFVCLESVLIEGVCN